MQRRLKKALVVIGALLTLPLAGAEAAQIDFLFNTGAIAGSTTNHAFTADEITLTTLGLSTVTLKDTSAPFGQIGVADEFIEIGLISAVNFQDNNFNIPVGTTGINNTYELIASFTLLGTATINPSGNLVATFTSASNGMIFYDETFDNAITAGASAVGALTSAFGDCVITAATSFTQGSCKITFAFDEAGVTDAGVWTHGANDIGNLQPAFLTLDINVNNVTPGFQQIYPEGPGSTQTTGLDSDGSAVFLVPNPGSFMMLGLGLVALMGIARRRIAR